MSAWSSPVHEPFALLAAAAVDGRLSAEEAEELERHLASCRDCRDLQRALLADHHWLAEPGPVAEPPARVRAAVLDAVRRPQRRGDSDRTTWALLAAACLVIAVAGAQAFGWRIPGVGGEPTPTPPATVGPTPSVPASDPGATPTAQPPWGRATGTAHGIEGTTATVEFDISVAGEGDQATGTVAFQDPDGTSWTGTIHFASWHYDPSAPWYVGFVEGCRTTETGCRTFVMQLIDGRGGVGVRDDISLSWRTQEEQAGQIWQLWYRLDSGRVEVAEPIGVGP